MVSHRTPKYLYIHIHPPPRKSRREVHPPLIKLGQQSQEVVQIHLGRAFVLERLQRTDLLHDALDSLLPAVAPFAFAMAVARGGVHLIVSVGALAVQGLVGLVVVLLSGFGRVDREEGGSGTKERYHSLHVDRQQKDAPARPARSWW